MTGTEHNRLERNVRHTHGHLRVALDPLCQTSQQTASADEVHATDEEILLRLRRLQSTFEYRFSMSLTYTFGSIFSSVVNPRFGQ